MNRLVAAALIALSAAACGGPVVPKDGTWNFLEGTVTADTCKVSPTPGEGNGTFVLANKPGGFTIDAQDSYEKFDCTLADAKYSCPSRARDQVDLGQQTGGLYTGILKVNVTIEGTFSSDSATSGTETADVTCEGTGCATAASYFGTSFPCSVTRQYSATAK